MPVISVLPVGGLSHCSNVVTSHRSSFVLGTGQNLKLDGLSAVCKQHRDQFFSIFAATREVTSH